MKKRPFACRALPAVVCTLLAFAVFFSSCSWLHRVTFTGNVYQDTKTGLTYRALSNAYEPVSRGDAYATVRIGDISHTLYRITDLEPGAFLSSAYNDVYCREDLSVPELADWAPSTVYVCTTTNVVVAELTLRRENADQGEVIDQLVRAYAEEEAVSYPTWADASVNRTLRFASERIPGLYYCLRYYEFTEDIYTVRTDEAGNREEVNLGRYFLYNRFESRCVPVDDTLHRLLEENE